MSKKQPAWKTDTSSFFHPNAHTAFLIVCPIVIAIAAGVFAFCFSYTYDFLTAPYHAEVEAKLEKITSGETEKWEYIESKEEEPNPNKRATRTYTESIYGYHWKYYIDDKPHEYVNTSSFGSEHKVGDVEKMSFWSYDGKEYYRSYGSGLNYIFMALSAVVILAALYIIIRIIIIKIIMSKEKRKKDKRREEQQSHPNASLINLGNFNGKRIRVIDQNGDDYEGIGEYLNKDYCEHEFGRREPCLQIANFNFFRSDVKDVISLKNTPYSAPFGRIEEMNFKDGVDSIEDELFCEEDDHVFRMLNCIEEHVVKKSEECPGLSGLLQNLLKTELSERTRKKAEAILQSV